VASDYPPLLADSLVLQRQADGQFALVQFAGIADQAEAQLQPVTGFSVREEQGAVHIEGLDVPFASRYLILSNPANAEEALDFPTLAPVELFARAGNRIGRENVYWVLDDDPALAAATRVPEGDCQREDSPYRWRFARNKAVAEGLRTFLGELEGTFPETRIRAVIPMGETSATEVRNEIAQLTRPDGTPYGPNDNGGVWSTINYIDTIGEGMAMLDLTGLRTEPVLFGIRDVPPAGPFDAHLRGSFRDLAENRGSSFQGPRSFFFEAQYTLRRQDYDTARAEREALILKVFSHKEEVNEVILYESADWLYFLPFGDPVLSGHGFLDTAPP
jgi:hypothetical protein